MIKDRMVLWCSIKVIPGLDIGIMLLMLNIYCLFLPDYQAQNITVNITVPTFGETPVMMVNGWIIIQQRLDSTLSFNQNWSSFQYGFGSIGSNYWLGNELVYQLMSCGQYKLRMEMLALGGGNT